MTEPSGPAEPVIMQPGEKLRPVPEQGHEHGHEHGHGHGGLFGLVIGSIGVQTIVIVGAIGLSRPSSTFCRTLFSSD